MRGVVVGRVERLHSFRDQHAVSRGVSNCPSPAPGMVHVKIGSRHMAESTIMARNNTNFNREISPPLSRTVLYLPPSSIPRKHQPDEPSSLRTSSIDSSCCRQFALSNEN